MENVALLVIKYFKGLPKSVLHPLDREFHACQKAAGGDPLELIRTLPRKYINLYINIISILFIFFF